MKETVECKGRDRLVDGDTGGIGDAEEGFLLEIRKIGWEIVFGIKKKVGRVLLDFAEFWITL